MPGSPGQQHHRPRHQPPPSTRSSSPTPVGLAWATSALTWPIGTAGAVIAPAFDLGDPGPDPGLLDRAPGLALPAPADPLDGHPAAFAAPIGHLGRFSHEPQATRVVRTDLRKTPPQDVGIVDLQPLGLGDGRPRRPWGRTRSSGPLQDRLGVGRPSAGRVPGATTPDGPRTPRPPRDE